MQSDAKQGDDTARAQQTVREANYRRRDTRRRTVNLQRNIIRTLSDALENGATGPARFPTEAGSISASAPPLWGNRAVLLEGASI